MFSGEDKFYISSFICLHLKFAISKIITIKYTNTKLILKEVCSVTHDYKSKLTVHFIGSDRTENETVEVNKKNKTAWNRTLSSFEKWF